jgi:hypothetical protein
MFKQLIGEGFYTNLTLGTTCWSLVPFHVACDRENELKNSSSFWKTMISKGARLERIPDEKTKARDLVYEIASHDAIALQTQRDIVDLGKSFSNLAVTEMINYELEELHKQQKAELQTLKETQQKLLAEERRARKLKQTRTRARNNRILVYQTKANHCLNNRPYGTCGKTGCYNKLHRWKVNWRKTPFGL